MANIVRNFVAERDLSLGYVLNRVKLRLETEQDIRMDDSPKLVTIENEIADSLYIHILRLLDDGRLFVVESLDAEENDGEIESLENSESSGESQASDHSEYDVDVDETFSCGGLNRKQTIAVCEYLQAHPSHKWNTLKKQFRFLAAYDESMLRKLRALIRSGDWAVSSRRELMASLDAVLWDKFQAARGTLDQIMDLEIERWALDLASGLGLTNFKASQSFVYRFKQRHGITSRRIQKFVSIRHIASLEARQRAATVFAESVRELLGEEQIRPEFVFNADQTGIPYEIVSNRTLSIKGEKSTFCRLHSVHASKHSFTAMFLITASGRLCDRTLLCLQEREGRFPPIMKPALVKPANVSITCTRSGLFTGSIYKYWVDNILSKELPRDEKSLLIVDSWSPHMQDSNYSSLAEYDMIRKIIPANTTSFAQPLDILFNRQAKTLLKYISKEIRNLTDNKAFMNYQRNSVILIVSLTQFQLSAPVFEPLIRYCFRKAKLHNGPLERFRCVQDICKTTSPDACAKEECQNSVKFNCAWCNDKYCIGCMVGISCRPHMYFCAVYNSMSAQ